MDVPTMTRAEAMDAWDAAHPDATPEERSHIEVFFDRVLLRRDDVLVYRSTVESSPTFGDVKLTSYGSLQSIVRRVRYSEIPRTMPDLPGEQNWPYEIMGVVRGLGSETH